MPGTDRVGDARRILVHGAPASGKSTLARRLSELTGIPLTDVDDLCWRPGWVAVPAAEQRALIDDVTAADAWILDSAYEGWRGLVLERADLVVALDYARATSLGRLLRRTVVRLVTREEVCHGNRESWRRVLSRRSMLVWHTTSFRHRREEVRAWERAPSGPPVVRLRTPAHGRAFLAAEAAGRPPTRR